MERKITKREKDELNGEIEEGEIKMALRKLKNGKVAVERTTYQKSFSKIFRQNVRKPSDGYTE